MLKLTLVLALFLTVPASAQTLAPVADHHQHVFSPALAEFLKLQTITAADVIKHLDDAGIKRAVLLSNGYSYGRPGSEPPNEYEKVKEENDWVAAQAAQFPKRLIAFCGFNPLKDYALGELERCAKNPNTRRGIKLHFGSSDIQVADSQHIEKLKAIFRAANANRMAIVMHFRASISKNRPYGPAEARALVEELLPLARNSTIQIAHLGSSGPGYNDPKIDAFMDALIDALYSKSASRSHKNVWFDLTTIVHPSNSPERSAMVAKRIRQIGVKRVVYGTDAVLGSNLPPKTSWPEVSKIGLTANELKTIARNQAPYFRP